MVSVPTNNGSKLRIYNLLRGLAKYHDVTLLSFVGQSNANPDTSAASLFCSEVHIIPWHEFDPNSMSARFGFFSLTPRSILDTFSSEMAGNITQLLKTQKYDLVIASQLSMAAYRPYFEKIPAIFEEVEIGSSYGEIHHSSIKKTPQTCLYLVQASHVSFAPSRLFSALYRSISPGKTIARSELLDT